MWGSSDSDGGGRPGPGFTGGMSLHDEIESLNGEIDRNADRLRRLLRIQKEYIQEIVENPDMPIAHMTHTRRKESLAEAFETIGREIAELERREKYAAAEETRHAKQAVENAEQNLIRARQWLDSRK